jgi:hypothetical protein
MYHVHVHQTPVRILMYHSNSTCMGHVAGLAGVHHFLDHSQQPNSHPSDSRPSRRLAIHTHTDAFRVPHCTCRYQEPVRRLHRGNATHLPSVVQHGCEGCLQPGMLPARLSTRLPARTHHGLGQGAPGAKRPSHLTGYLPVCTLGADSLWLFIAVHSRRLCTLLLSMLRTCYIAIK